LKCLIVDDSVSRVKLIKKSLSDMPNAHLLEVVYCDSADRARIELTQPFDLMLLDVLIPKKKNGTPQALHSINLLSEICHPKKSYIRPRLIIGLTADIAELGVYQEEFAREMAVVLRGSLTELDWLESLHAQIASVMSVTQKINQHEKDRLLISVHGIRTYGQWQAKLSDEVAKSSRSFDSTEIKYGRFDLICFAIPYFRRRVVERESRKIIKCLSGFTGQEIHIIAHSFGTLIVSAALKKAGQKFPIKTVVLCGSPMQSDENIDHIVKAAEITVNECGIHDFVLIAARLFLLGLGDAGRIGFQRANNRSFQNRYFPGGHSLYFDTSKGEIAFYERHWIPRIALGKELRRVDLRKEYIGEDFVDIFIKIFSRLKPILYCGGALFVGYSIWMR
jgi:CheY-like chemotaxis protein